ncbi:MAG: hypothetical protein AAFZ18_12745 [Myxococcota bacterium]
MIPPLQLGPLRLHWEVVLVALGVGVLGRPSLGAALAIVIVTHELGHAIAAALLRVRGLAGTRMLLPIQLGSGVSYLPESSLDVRGGAVLLAGLGLGFPSALAIGALIQDPVGSADLRTVAEVWLVFQLVPAPVTDGGVLAQRLLEPRLGRVRSWWLGWALAAGVVSLLVWRWPGQLPVIAWLSGLAVLLGRSEAAHVRHLEIYDAFEAERWNEVIKAALRTRLPPRERLAVAELGIHAGFELGDEAAVSELLLRLPAGQQLALEAATWLLRRGRADGAVFAERIHHRVDGGRPVDAEAYADLAFFHAVYAAHQGHQETALGLLERAVEHGFDDADRWRAEGAFEGLRDHPRHRQLEAAWVHD